MEYYSKEEDEIRASGYLNKLQDLIFNKQTIQMFNLKEEENIINVDEFKIELIIDKNENKENIKENIDFRSTIDTEASPQFLSSERQINKIKVGQKLNYKAKLMLPESNLLSPNTIVIKQKINGNIKQSQKNYYKGLTILKEETLNQSKQIAERLKMIKEGKVIYIILIFKEIFIKKKKYSKFEFKKELYY